MAFRINKQERQRLDDLRDKINAERLKLNAATEYAKTVIEDAYEKANDAIEAYNDLLSEAQDVIEDIYNERQGEFDDKSERWYYSERGEATREWLDSLESLKDNDLKLIEKLEFEAFEVDPEQHSDLIDNIEEEPVF